MIGPALFGYLASQTALNALVGDRIFPLMIPETEKAPAVTYTRVNADRQIKFCGTSRLIASYIIINSFATSSLMASQIAAVVRDAMIDYRGMMGDVNISGLFLDSEIDLIDEAPGLFQVSQSYLIWHHE